MIQNEITKKGGALTHLPDIYVEKPDQLHFEANAIVWFLDPNTNPEWPRPSLKAFLAASL